MEGLKIIDKCSTTKMMEMSKEEIEQFRELAVLTYRHKTAWKKKD